MAEVIKTVLVPYSAQQMFGLVADVEAYPTFLPWCGGARVSAQADGSVLAEVDIAFKGLKQSFCTRNLNTPGERIDMSLHSGPFRSLAGHWRFQALNDQACKVAFELDYHFSSRILEKLVGPVFAHITGSFVDAFVQRAERLYGAGGSGTSGAAAEPVVGQGPSD
jgi:ribosome-associated toxin RatA of RatAB toxin-antitoxin module